MPKNSSDLFAEPTKAAAHASIRVGIGGWTFAPWRKNFYPDGLVQRRELEYASRQLRTIEINGTFYRAQTPAVYAKWAAETPDDFVFSLKAPKAITEGRKLAEAKQGAKRFISGGLSEFGSRLGPILWQLPPSRAFDHDDLASFLDTLPRELNGRALRHVLEVRHESFLSDAYVSLARAHGVPTVFTDSASYPSLADVTGDFIYARLMRSESEIDTGYAAKALDGWAKRAGVWAAGGDPVDLPHVGQTTSATAPRDVFVYFISSAKETNPAAAMALQTRVDALR
jgi:uncharacterized protein YecE (DUF72 family)